MKKMLTGALLALSSTVALASPDALYVDNNTDSQARAYVHGISRHPVEPHSTMSLSWTALKIVCLFNTMCEAEVKAETDSKNPIVLGKATINLDTGEIDTSTLQVIQGYKVSYVGPGHVRLDKE